MALPKSCLRRYWPELFEAESPQSPSWPAGRIPESIETIEVNRAKENGMTDHTELLKDARELANNVDDDSALVIWNLAGIVEARDKRDAALEGRIERYLETKLLTVDGLVAACKRCVEMIGIFTVGHPILPSASCTDEPTGDDWINLEAARRLAKQAIEKADTLKSEDEVKASLVADAVAQIETGDNDFMDADEFKAQAEKPTQPTNEQATRNITANIPSNAQLRKGARREGAGPPDSWRQATDDPFQEESTIAVEMQIVETCDGYTWEVYLANYWVLVRDLTSEDLSYCDNREKARQDGKRWLATLSEQLGVKLVARWEGEIAEASG